MKKVSELKIGDGVIYIKDECVKVSKVVPKPIDDGQRRPKFKVGRTDLANGDYLINTDYVYDDTEEATKALIERFKKEIKNFEDQKLVAEGMIILYKHKLEQLEDDISI